MTYSCALWDDSSEEKLITAQNRKLNYHIDNVLSTSCRAILDIGCGWGSLINSLANRANDASIDGLTLSQEQYNYVLDKFSANDKISVYLESWEHYSPKYLYDGIVSVGAFEHFVKAGMPRKAKVKAYSNFFDKCASMMKPKANISLQTIVYENYDEHNPNKFVEEIFPESDLPRQADIMLA